MTHRNFAPLLATLMAGALFSLGAAANPAEASSGAEPEAKSEAKATPALTPFSATYSASMSKGIKLNGAGKRELISQDNGIWLYRTEVDSFIADINESLVFRWDDGQVVPLRYRYELSGLMISDRKQAIDFDWQAGLATGHYRGEPFELKLKEGALDPLGYQMQLRQDLKTGKREMAYPVIDKGDYDEERFAVLENEQLRLNGHTLDTLKAEKVRDSDSKRKTLMWFTPSRDYLLVRLRQVEPDGTEYELRLKDADLQS